MPSVSAPPRTALLAGATGLVGRALLAQLLLDTRTSRVHALVRRSVAGIEAHAKLQMHSVNFNHPAALPRSDDVYIALGTTLKVAGSRAAFQLVDRDYVIAVARAARAAGARRLAVVSALGADPLSRVFYNRIKGEMEAAIGHLDFECITVARPALLMGDRGGLGQPERRGESLALRLSAPLLGWLPRGIRPIAARDVAAALIAATHLGTPGVRVLSSAQMQGADRR
jgi:uncharacterized protein YbjT (DUF2867 family)